MHRFTSILMGMFIAATSVATEPTQRDVEYANVGNRKLLLDVYEQPTSSQTASPLVVWIHGGAWRSGSKNSVPVTHWLEQGFSIASVDYRLSPEAKFPAQIHDIKASIRYLRANAARFRIDPNRIVIAGSSAGGHLAALAGVSDGVEDLEGSLGEHTTVSSRVQAIVSFFGASNLQSILSQSTEFGLSVRVPALQLFLGGQPAEVPDLTKLASPVAHVDSRDPPLWLIHGDADPQMPFDQSREFAAAYQRVALPVQLDVVKGGKHGGDEFFTDTRLAGLAAQIRATIDRVKPVTRQPNVLFIAMDDLNDWIGCLGGHPQSITPNLDRLAASGVLFTNAHCPAPACNPSRSAVFTGRAPHRSGLYDNRQLMREVMPNELILPAYFRQHGYRAAGSGKLLHYFIDAKSWDDYFPKLETENPLPETYYPPKRPVSLPRGGPWQYVETDWAALDVSDEVFGGDWSVSHWIGDQLQKSHDKPFFLGCGIYRPHEPWFVPKKYFDPFPIESIQLPPGYKADDLDDVPALGVQAAKNRYFAHIQEQGQWKQGLQGYLASIHFGDAMLGRVLDALESGPNAENTIVVLWSDHGWQLGEKEHWQKFTPWRAVTHVPLMIRVPKGIAAKLPEGTRPGTRCDAPVNLLSLFPTLTELCGLPAKEACDGLSLLPLLKDASADWPHHSVTFTATPETYSISGRTHRYIHYRDGSEELYDIRLDPYEWTNLARRTESANQLAEFRQVAPTNFAARLEPSVESLTVLTWHPIVNGKAPPSKPDGNPFLVYFENQRTTAVELFWMDPQGGTKSYGRIDPAVRMEQQTRPGAVWMVADAKSQQPLGFFVVDDRTARAIVSAASP
jgi:arylsulfatase A-like enzyme/acetyl esterase/lipase